MTSNTVDELGRAVLEAMAEGRASADELEDRFDAPRAALDERLSQLADNGLLRTVNGEEYEVTGNGRRLLTATPTGELDDRIDTPARVDRAIEGDSLRPDEAAAVRSAFSFLRYWGEATAAELVDAVYSEVPAGYETADRWWNECVSDRLESLPDVRRSSGGPDGGKWRYEGTAVRETPDDRDGREAVDANAEQPYGSVRHALEALDLRADERAAARAAFVALFDRRRASTDALVEYAYDEHSAGYDSAEEWATWLSSTLEALPGVERSPTDEDGPVWTYDPSAALG